MAFLKQAKRAQWRPTDGFLSAPFAERGSPPGRFLLPLEFWRAGLHALRRVAAGQVAFDRRGARMGHGFGYYDKLLQHARPDAPLVALAFECQVFDEIPTAAHDIFMDKIITEKAVYPGRGRHGG